MNADFQLIRVRPGGIAQHVNDQLIPAEQFDGAIGKRSLRREKRVNSMSVHVVALIDERAVTGERQVGAARHDGNPCDAGKANRPGEREHQERIAQRAGVNACPILPSSNG